MKLVPFVATCVAVAVLAQPALAWTNEDHELFDIVSALESAEGKGTNFYSFLNTTKSATEKEINKAYRKRSLELHPDKNPNNKKVADRFARLGLITNILRDAEKRKRYDFFYENGVPKWRGTGYYYSRYRPGLGSVVTGLFIFSLFIQYLFLYLTARVQKMRITAFRTQALEAAWGPTKEPQPGKKKLKVKTGDQGDPLGLPGVNGGKPIGAGSTIEMMIEGNDVYIVENRKETLLTEDLAVKPTWQDTWLPAYIIPRYLPSLANKRSTHKKRKTLVAKKPPPGFNATSGSSSGEDDQDDATKKVKKDKGPGRGVIGDGKVGGRRRKTIPRPSTPTTKKD
ncbi:J domain-containing protein [Sporobolomyces koalae]|uniref:J domain-containing protein n=1 Tax=Sporobolomyces koalae TaxID=500713 RepID=UPI0031702042